MVGSTLTFSTQLHPKPYPLPPLLLQSLPYPKQTPLKTSPNPPDYESHSNKDESTRPNPVTKPAFS
jgi:hypothetical protein